MTDADIEDRAGHAGQSVENELIRSEFRKVALLELELGQARSTLESLLPESTRLRDELAEAQRRAAELEGELAAQAKELQSMRRSASWRVTRPFRVMAKRMGLKPLKRQPADRSAT